MSIRANLIAGRALIANPETFGQGEYAYGADRKPISPQHESAVCFCSLGAVERVIHRGTMSAPEKMALAKAAKALHGPLYNVIRVNDELGHEATLQMWDYAIEHAPN
ncbi:hypothetical protein [Methylobacterium sp. WL120]|uniref:DUF6197 family protein n=1 Tax=Methylobacterium sp. WL120 TaxID=2603887 RepID=UPI0011C9610C|nr:hypothetical protein [Methylobacterium sp. WL120]TXM69671.1 hypothetical protein FV229_04820 [Methylobacterium sp. WL120]